MADLGIRERPARAAPNSLRDRLDAAFHATQATRAAPLLMERLRLGCWIYGAGGYGRLVAGLLGAQGIAVHGFIDRKGETAANSDPACPTLTPDAFGAGAGTTLVVAVHNFAADQAPVVAWARTRGFAEIVIPAELPDLLGPAAGSYWLTGRAHTHRHLDAIDRVAARLADPRSVAVLEGIATFRLIGDIAAHPPSHLASQYFPPDVPLTRAPLRLVDGGAYNGDSYAAGLAAGATFAEWYAFEPDPANFRDLVATAANARLDRVALFPCGLGDRCEQIHFASGGDAGSHAATAGDGDMAVQVVALDEVLPGLDPNYVKLDIEGYERAALAGMRRTLARSRPDVAVSIYHRPEDLWELPLLMAEMLPDAALYIRQHGYNGFDTVLYVVS